MTHSPEVLYATFMEYWEKHVQPYEDKRPQRLYAPIHYIARGGGKRMRPLFMMMLSQWLSDEVETVLPAAFCVELFHNFTLLHDDIMDEAPLRRGRATVHEKWDVNTGILSGDLMMIESLRHLSALPDNAVQTQVSEHFLQAAVAVCEGQQLDMDFENREDVQLPEYMQMIAAKTAALLAEGMAMAAICCGAESEVQTIRKAGYAIGTAFQIQDDILDTYGDPAKFGKKVGGDIAQNKKTYLYLRSLEMADAETAKELRACYSADCPLPEKEKIERVRGIFDQVGVREDAENQKKTHTQAAFDALDQIKGKNPAALSLLKDFAGKLVRREA